MSSQSSVQRARAYRGFAFACIAVSSSCVLAPGAARDEQAAVARAGDAYRAPFAERRLPDLPATPTWRDVVTRTLLASGELEAAYYDWAAAAHRIDQAGAYPNTAFSLDVSRALSGGGNGIERTSLALGFDPMENLAFPTKVYHAAKVATDEARTAGQRLVALRFDVQRRTLNAWHEYVLLAERLRLARAQVALATVEVDAAVARVAGGGDRQMVMTAESARLLAVNAVATLAATEPGARARLNAGMGRAADVPLVPPAQLEPPRPLPADDAWVLGIAAARDPELATLAREVEGRRDALALARQQYIPDFNPFVGTDGAAAQMAGVVISIPTLLREVGAMVRAARAELDAAEARQRQAQLDRTAAVVAALALARDAERRADLYAGPLQAVADRAVVTADVAYGGDVGAYGELLQARRTRLDVRLLAAEARTMRAQAVADLEALLGVDAETLAATAPAAPLAVAEVAR